MVKAVLSKKRGSGRGSGNFVRLGDPVLDKAWVLLRKLSLADLHAVVPVLEKYALHQAGDPDETHPPVPFSAFADYIETLDSMIVDSAMHDVESCDASDLGTFIHNEGTASERAEALLAIMPVATRVFQRYDAAQDALRAKSRAASAKLLAEKPAALKGKK